MCVLCCYKRDVLHYETASSLHSMIVLVLQNFHLNSKHWLMCLIWTFLPSVCLISLGFKIFKSYWSCPHAVQLCGASVLWFGIEWSCLDWFEWQLSHHMSYHCLQLSSFKNVTSRSPETELLKRQSQMGTLLIWSKLLFCWENLS